MKSTNLSDEIDRLRQIINDPEEYIWENFSKMKNEIDLEFEHILDDVTVEEQVNVYRFHNQ